MPLPADLQQGVTLHIIAKRVAPAEASPGQPPASSNPLLEHAGLDNAVRHASAGDLLLVMDPALAANLAAADSAMRNETLRCFEQVYLHVGTRSKVAKAGSETAGSAPDLHSADDNLFVTLVTASARSITW